LLEKNGEDTQVRYEEVLHMEKKERIILQLIKGGIANWIAHISVETAF
jgi:hypothetical protein